MSTNPRSEIRSPKEFRIPDSELPNLCRRPSDFGLRPSFGFRPSGFGFTLIEVMIASGIFFMATFAILALVAGTLRNARSLEKNDVDIGMAASLVYETLKTNKFEEGTMQGDFGDVYPEYSFSAEWRPSDLALSPADSPGMPANSPQAPALLEANIILNRRGSPKPVDFITILVYAPNVTRNGPR